MKGKKKWTRWFADKIGFGGTEWAESWAKELASSELPGSDFILKAVNTAGDEWLPRAAEYSDARRMLHLVLMIYFGFSATDAVSYNPHGFRHILVTAGQQLKHYGIVAEEDLDLLGHLARGSSMPRSYDASAGVSEMQVRSVLLTQIRRGWRPCAEGCLPAEPIGNGGIGAVAHKGTRTMHKYDGGSRAFCRVWACGTPSRPARYANFSDIPAAWKKCPQCG
jgi:hypothetical protein